MFKKLLASLGVGAAQVDTQLEKDQFIPGETVKGKVVVKGGDVDQDIDAIHIFLMTEAIRESNDNKIKEKVSLMKYPVAQKFSIKEGEVKELPFSIQIPFDTPASLNRLPIWFETGLDIPMALDPEDRDPIKIAPHPYVDRVLHAFERLDFRLKKVEMEISRQFGVVQEFEFLPGTEFRSTLDELEAIFLVHRDKIQIMLEVDRRAKGLGGLFAEALELDESRAGLSFTKQEMEENPSIIEQKLRKTIQRYSQ